jgi:hypothetical protein
MGTAVPNEPFGNDRHMMGGTLPLPHQNGAGPPQCLARAGRAR